jgi:lambda repressor-like predicted transcriptional regulator
MVSESNRTAQREAASQKLRELRLSRGMSIRELGRAAGISLNTVRNAELQMLPEPRCQLAMARVFDLGPLDIWPLEIQR